MWCIGLPIQQASSLFFFFFLWGCHTWLVVGHVPSLWDESLLLSQTWVLCVFLSAPSYTKAAGVDWRKNVQPKVSSSVLIRDLPEDWHSRRQLSDSSDQCSEERKVGASIHRTLGRKQKHSPPKKPHVVTQQVTANHKTTRHFKFMILVLFYM